MNKHAKNNKEILVVAAEPYLNDQLFNAQDAKLNRDNCLAPGIELRDALREKGISLKTVDLGNLDNAQWIIFQDTFPNNPYLKECLAKKLNHKMVLMLWEPPAVLDIALNKQFHSFFRYVLTWNDDLVDNERYFKLHWPQPPYEDPVDVIPFAKKKLLVSISANKFSYHSQELYSERVKAINYFNRVIPDDFDFYGVGWESNQLIFSKHPVRLLRNLIRHYKHPNHNTYRGRVKDKIQKLSHYKFSICYENMHNIKGWVSEKIFDSFKASCIPIYWGASNINDFVPADCFIDMRGRSYDDLLARLVSFKQDEHAACVMAIKEFMASKKYEKFSIANYIDTLLTLLLHKKGSRHE